jgi:hypothetical protein
MSDRAAQPNDSAAEPQVSPEAIRAGVKALKENYLSLQEVTQFPEIARIVYAAMSASRR